MSKEYISFYALAKEMAAEDNSPFVKKIGEEIKVKDNDQFKDYSKAKQRNFENILKIQGINPNIKYKATGEYKIPVEEKEIIKLILREYTSAYLRKIKKNGISKLEEVEDIVKKSVEVINQNYKEPEKEKQLSYLYGILEYHSRKTGREVCEEITKMISESIDNIKIDKRNMDPKQILENNKQRASCKSIDDVINENDYSKSDDLMNVPKYRCLNDEDAEFLIKYFEHILTFTIKSWNDLVDTFSEIREEEIENASLEMLDLDENIEFSNNCYEIYEEPEVILKKSMRTLNTILKNASLDTELDEEEINKLGDIIKSLKPNKK